MTIERVDYIIRVSFSTPLAGDSLSPEEQAGAIMDGLMQEIAADVDEAEIVHRRIFEAPDMGRPPTAWIPLPCVRCRRFMVTGVERHCAACWGIAQ
jgi:hypothetical protein